MFWALRKSPFLIVAALLAAAGAHGAAKAQAVTERTTERVAGPPTLGGSQLPPRRALDTPLLPRPDLADLPNMLDPRTAAEVAGQTVQQSSRRAGETTRTIAPSLLMEKDPLEKTPHRQPKPADLEKPAPKE